MHRTKNEGTLAKIFWFFGLFIFTTVSFAKEPINLSEIKKGLVRYHESGEYEKDVERVVNDIIRYLSRQKTYNKKAAIVIDIDETVLSNFTTLKKLNFGGSLEEIQREESKGINPPILPALKLYHFARKNNLAMIFVAGRPEHERKSTIRNLHKVGIKTWEGLYLRPQIHKDSTAATFKTEVRKMLIAQGYKIVANIGDQTSDIVGGYAEKHFKFPNPFYMIP